MVRTYTVFACVEGRGSMLSETVPNAQQAVFSPFYKIQWRDDSCIWSLSASYLPWLERARFLHAITASNPLSFEIIAPSRDADGLFIMLANDDSANSAPLWCELTDPSGNLLACSQTDPITSAEEPFCKILDLRNIPLSI